MPRPRRRTDPAADLSRTLVAAIEANTATVSVIGQGYVGLSVAAAAARAGMRTIGVDLDADRVASLSSGQQVVPGVDDELFVEAFATGRLGFTTDPAVVGDSDVVLICVPTPLIDSRPDLAAIEGAGAAVGRYLMPGTLVILESTTYPGTTEQVLRPLLESHGRVAGADLLLAYSPERINPGDHAHGFAGVPRVVGGLTEHCTAAAAAFYGRLVDIVHPVSSCRAAELAKLLENTYRLVNIALVNELAQLCADQGIDTWEVIDAAATKPFGFQRFEPGPGVGGHCIPLDPAYLTWQSRRDTGRPFRLVELAKDINDQMPSYTARRIMDSLNRRGIAVKGSKLLALGVTYKPDVGDVRESAAIQVLAHLSSWGAKLSFHDPFVTSIDEHGVKLRRRRLTEDLVRDADAVILLTPHATYDLDEIAGWSSLLFDARNATGRRDHPDIEVL
ncbi:nucleotide sugar dehydrogenase [Acidimicrobiia bacterium EGI L10123]|uniref:nucleotide sugar dehydrogenase n=1 Tax=Salinilacustrithrix flava TaxID=2957203 RepID=UPI003D7C292A|nr:nucleotide sugar dehydrogenase [Acidimicrobiia bacterium EGI L10123]